MKRGQIFVAAFGMVVFVLSSYALILAEYDRKCACCFKSWAFWSDKDDDPRCYRHRVRS